MEEAREKIELFRHYYLVCFRSFDQDQYSPTHLEPLNMYIIVFREGILSVSLFTYHGTTLISPWQIPVCPLPFCGALVPLPSDPPPTERTSPNQATQGLHQRHFRLDFIRPNRRYHGCLWASYPIDRVRSRLYR